MEQAFRLLPVFPGSAAIWMSDGTTILIRDLFYNVPVRQKFMKRDTTEANAVSMIVQKIALSHPQIAFQMIRDNRMEFRTDGTGDLFSAIYGLRQRICT